ncbi:hypothetical protein BT96DRAFT_994443 [Gymnopus androsaceus JB14]|uniref:RNase H type-1 domain-containing protein n=1 Tax=Gymnopus androsaceus JB14 TaxID=1447944 RepID=A0A6A4HQ11_9AGAR|nr:hypothetical protein BT96DRAFT_994443 [Gymnopus androsaceus JB14]
MLSLSATFGTIIALLAAQKSGLPSLNIESDSQAIFSSHNNGQIPDTNGKIWALTFFEVYEEPMWVTEREKLEAKREGRDCTDITEHRHFGTSTYTSLIAA